MTVENILTVDLEDWFHICGVEDYIPPSRWTLLESRVVPNTQKILEILSRKNVRATFFVLGFVAQRHPRLIQKIHGAGHEIAAHGYAHRHVYAMTPDAFRHDLKKAARIISEITGQPVRGYRAAEWSIRDDCLWALNILIQEGFEYDSSMAPLPIIGNPRYARIPFQFHTGQGKLWEFPPLVLSLPLINLPLGGGWGLRVFPYSLIRATVRRFNRKGQPALIFLHPREFDHHLPRIRLPILKRLVLNARLQRTENRLNRLLNDFSFTSVSAAIKRLNSSE
jgi:polysaccharide deacetylase family protein (PEP-CTERM system associated)